MNSTAVDAVNLNDDLEALCSFLPYDIAEVIRQNPQDIEELKVRYMRPLAIKVRGKYQSVDHLIIDADHILDIAAKTGDFRDDGRKGIPGTGHRLSRLLAADGALEGVTIRVGRFLKGVAEPLRPHLKEPKSILVIAPPAAGKTTLLRDIIRIMADDLHMLLVIVDSSNELSGDGKPPHHAIGNADRLQVSAKSRQADYINECIRNHGPGQMVLDEIGYAGDADLVKLGIEGGVKVIASAHGARVEHAYRKKDLLPLFQPQVLFDLFVLITARGVYELYNAPEACRQIDQGFSPTPIATLKL